MTITLPPPTADGYRLFLDRTTWEGYQQILAELDAQGRRYRSTYSDGLLEILVPGKLHEKLKTSAARLLETYGLATGQLIEGLGSTTFASEMKKRGLEPDECYLIGRADRTEDKTIIPDLAIEIDITSSSIPREEVYARLGVPELWRWRDDGLQVLRLQRGKYKLVPRSIVLPQLDLVQFARFVKQAVATTQSAAAAKWFEWVKKNR